MSPDGEYAASAAYAAVLARYGDVEPYLSIKAQEDMHVAALTRQLDRLGVAVPENPWIGRIPAPDDLRAAARAWASGEVDNIEMYDDLLADAGDDPQLARVLTNLRAASQDSHLPLFELAASLDGTLTTSELSASDLTRKHQGR